MIGESPSRPSEGGYLGAFGLGGTIGLCGHGLKALADPGGAVGAEQPLDERRCGQPSPLDHGRLQHLQGHLRAHDPAAQVRQDQDTLAPVGEPLDGIDNGAGVGAQLTVGEPCGQLDGDVDGCDEPACQVKSVLGQTRTRPTPAVVLLRSAG